VLSVTTALCDVTDGMVIAVSASVASTSSLRADKRHVEHSDTLPGLVQLSQRNWFTELLTILAGTLPISLVDVVL
jgi:hypothetical protein